MSSNDIAILIACISGVVSLTAAFGVEWIRQRSNSAKLAQDKALEEVRDQLARGREAATKAEEAERLIAKYRDPLLRSAYDLQSRIYNVCRQDGFTGSRDPEYFRLNTLFLFGEFLAWLEIIRREIQFLDVGAVQVTKDLSRKVQEVQDQLASTSELHDDFFLYRGHQRAIGELMLVRTDGQAAAGPRYECMGYAAFVAAHEDLSFAKWFTRIGAAVEQLRAIKPERLVWVQHALIDLINLLDPDHERFERNRERLPVPESPRRRPSRRPGSVTSRAPRS